MTEFSSWVDELIKSGRAIDCREAADHVRVCKKHGEHKATRYCMACDAESDNPAFVPEKGGEIVSRKEIEREFWT